ncbi:MAG: hypothetical protein HYW95_02130 [Candidatus Wildermuthbacteria bacterium]|nr:hypothetical protein [Candidatus Wildermuthbacteria bacterium]
MQIIFLLIVLIFVPWNSAFAKEAQFIIDAPDQSSMTVGDEFEASIELKTEESILSVKAYIYFDPSLVEVESINRNKSNFPYWWEEASSLEDGTGLIRLQASAPTPGVQGDAHIAKVNFKKIGTGAALFTVDPSSLALTPQDKNILAVDDSPRKRNQSLASFLPENFSADFTKEKITIGILFLFALVAVLLFFVFRRKIQTSKE